MLRLIDSFEQVSAERWPEVLKEFFGVDFAEKPVTLTWPGAVTATWARPDREEESRTFADSSVKAVIYSQTEVDGSVTSGIDLVGTKAFGHFSLEFNNSKDEPFYSDNHAVFYSRSTKTLYLIRRDVERNRDQIVHFLKTKTDQMMFIFEDITVGLPDGLHSREKATLKVAR